METNQYLREVFDSFYDFLKEKELEFGLRPISSKVSFSESELMEALDVSRATLYRARKNGLLPFRTLENGAIEYDYDTVLLALKTNRFRIAKIDKAEAISKLTDFKNIKNFGYDYD